ncbi:MAG: thioredoxin domain-containing protein, partial [Acidobacteriota bacterium]
ETSPYLLQHANNPVDWYPWGPEALERARREDRPILLSIGYSACHWCHVMERESFENDAIARLMNENFVNIKVDREERPDLDTIYMNAIQMMTGHGGWPMTVFLTPDQVPFYGGTYFPPADRHGLPGFPRVLISLAEAYRTQHDEIVRNSASVLTELKKLNQIKVEEGELSIELLDRAAHQLLRTFDPVNGGFGSRPKFPPSMGMTFLLRQFRRTGDTATLAAVEMTLEKMAHGGIYDQLGGAFHRYSVDERWLVPHFEKMLYDNALLARIYLDAYLVTGNGLYSRIATETLDYVSREMTNENGGFYSTQDADSEGEEGKFFVWSPQEVEAWLGAEDAKLFGRYFDITTEGNFEGLNILHVDTELDDVAALLGVDGPRLAEVVERGRGILFAAREERIKPARDEKILTAWNGLMMRSFAEASQVLGRADYREIAVRNAEFLLGNLRRDGRLLRTHKDGESKLNGYLEDYAYLADGLLSLYEATFDSRWFIEARALVETMIDQFWDEENAGFYFTGKDHENLISRTKDYYDNAIPAGNSVAIHVLLRLSMFTSEMRYREMAERSLRQLKDVVLRAPSAFGHLLCAFDLLLGSALEITVIGERGES